MKWHLKFEVLPRKRRDQFPPPDRHTTDAKKGRPTSRDPRSVSKKLLETLRSQGGVPRGILDIAMPEIRLDRTRVVPIVGELVAASMAEHVGVRLDTQVGRGGCPLDQAGETGRR